MAALPSSLTEKVKLLSGDGPWHTHAVAGLPVGLPFGRNNEYFIDAVICPALQTQTLARRQAADAAALQNAGDFALVAVNPIVLACCQAAGIFRELRVSVQVYKAQCALFAAGRQRVRDAVPHTPAAGVGCGVAQVDAVADAGGLVAFFGRAFDLRGGFGWPGLYSRSACSLGERKYFSSTSFIKISDKVHALSCLRYTEICAVKNLPFDKIPQLFHFAQDGRKCPPAVMVEQAGNIFSQPVLRVPGFSQSGKLKEQGAPWVVESAAASGNAEALARKSAAEQVEVGQVGGVCFSDIVKEPLSLHVKQGAVAAVGVFVDLAVSHADKIAGTGQPLAEAPNAGEHI